ncbi:hypothetical protein PV387_39400 [Streptomyces sp. ME02-6987-2C]|uniref:hypothetical protein n=1 Tax=unclassified Streptomyces TaxID=2593676 RepID=UPI0029B15D83|nr:MULTISPECIES: hypothetical protein [unclassified Streptomyces]MDX3345935.1 hypothetical protein [Streptomyces sp. ME02-6979A]MDX3371985.1 hypothetical protein [Streptomyces sp. ME02-6987-2C]MDX3412205.1 hypothetical protein [Streptomyces sp. ME02-6977A]MDX3421701.1 hypothetical protein [Streptomyces sp. ME02-6985-2c]
MNQYAIAARRLRLAADVFEARAHHRTSALLDIVARGFRSAAGAFGDVAPGGPADLPEELQDAVTALTVVFQAHDFGLSAALVGYAVAPVTGEIPVLAGHGAVGEQLAQEDHLLQFRRRAIIRHRHLDAEDDEIVAFALRVLAGIHYQHERLGVVVAADNGRPCNQGKAPYCLPLPTPRQPERRGTR